MLLTPSPKRAKRAQAGNLSAKDIGLTMHAFLSENVRKRSVVVSTSPDHILPLIDGATDVAEHLERIPIVMSLDLLTLDDLQSAEVWTCDPTCVFSLDMSMAPHYEKPPDGTMVLVLDMVQDLAYDVCMKVGDCDTTAF